ncbi:S-layer domain protein (fragment) [uncultured Eubacteriales bacterium]|uniref:S-layer domain protein n=1 Tax=uncultured Eubacteriales bacterium TaxID=172733 RepID=A0A212KB22_9FIRM
MQVVPGRYDATTGLVTFTTTHFSKYVVGSNKISFSDVSASDWYADAVSFIAARQITIGTTADTFTPNGTLTRGQFIVMLMRAYGIEPGTDTADNFSDAGDVYYTAYLAKARQLGITNGVGNNRFAPDQAITRQDMFTLLYRALDTLGSLPKGSESVTISDYADSAAVSDYAEEAVGCFLKAGVITGAAGHLNPEDTTTRAEMAQVLYKLLSV